MINLKSTILQEAEILKLSRKSLSKDERIGYIYLTENLVNHKIYIGKRCLNWFYNKYHGSGVALKRAIGKYGEENFKTEPILWGSTKEDLSEAERYFIAILHDLDPDKKYHYNIAEGGDGGNTWDCLSEEKHNELRRNLSEIHSGKSFTDEHKRNISRSLKGRSMTEEHREHLSESLKHSEALHKALISRAGNMSEKAKQNISIAQKKRYISKNEKLQLLRNSYKGAKKTRKSVIGFNINSEKEICFDSTLDASRYLSIEVCADDKNRVANIIHCCKGRISNVKGYIWRYADEYDMEVYGLKRMNQYSMDVYEYNIEHGTDIFMEYKKPETTEERKRELEEVMFNILRKRNEVPIQLLTDLEAEQDMIRLSNTEYTSTYDEESGDFGFNPVGVTFLNQFFKEELCDIRKPTAKRTIKESFYDDTVLRRVIRKSLAYTSDETGIFRWILLTGAGYCVNFRPAVAKAIYEAYGKDKKGMKVFDSSAGYGARMLGAHFASNVVEYLGIDPNTADSCKNEIEYLDSKFPTGTKKQVLKMGSEDFTPEAFPQYQNYFDLYFTSPPYFNTEQYSDAETQSYKKFPTYAGWVQGFYQATIDNACSALKADGVFAINIFEKVPNIKELTKLFLANNGWYVVRTDKYLMKAMPGVTKDENGNKVAKTRGKYDNFEPVWKAYHISRLLKEGLITEEQAKQFKERAIKDTHAID